MTHYYITPAVDGEVVREKARKEANETGQVITVHAHAKGQDCSLLCQAIYQGPVECDKPHARSCRRCP